MTGSTAKRVAIAVAAGLLIAIGVCWAPGSRPDPAPTATEVALPAPAAAPTPTLTLVPTESPARTPTPSRTATPAPPATAIPTLGSDQGAGAVATSTPFTLSDLAATSTPISALLPPALPSVTVPPTPTATPGSHCDADGYCDGASDRDTGAHDFTSFHRRSRPALQSWSGARFSAWTSRPHRRRSG